MPSPQASRDDEQRAEFAFVSDSNQDGTRSHAMREHWKQRRKRLSMKKQRDEEALARPRKLLPSSSENSAVEQSSASISRNHNSAVTSHSSGSDGGLSPGCQPRPPSPSGGIPSQALSGMNMALGCGRLDPFDSFPVKLSPQHHQLLHHWLVTYAAMMFDHLSAGGFNPMRDVWFPLDLSNAASFNAIMAHSAAHLARMQGSHNSMTAAKFKAEAVRIVTLWMGDAEHSTSDEVIAAVLRLLTYERYWGTEAEWRVHHEGLRHLIEARGGIEALQSNWRIGLPSYLVSLMAKPSWFDTSNQIEELSAQPFNTNANSIIDSSDTLHRVRCLWLLSFVQDIGTFMCNAPRIIANGLTQYPAIMDALLQLQRASRVPEDTLLTDMRTCTIEEFTRLSCLLFICVLVQDSLSASGHGSWYSELDLLGQLDAFLNDTRQSWQWSVNDLHNTLIHHFAAFNGGASKTDYVVGMANVLGSLSLEARRGVENCLSHMLCRTGREANYGAFDENWTPDSLLASIHGQ